MARTRDLKPGFFKNEYLAELGPYCQVLYAGLWTLADCEGRLEDRPARIKAELLPYYDVNVDELLNKLFHSKERFIVRYEVEGEKYIWIPKFKIHQNPHPKEKVSGIPAPKEEIAEINGEKFILSDEPVSSRVIIPIPSFPSFPSGSSSTTITSVPPKIVDAKTVIQFYDNNIHPITDYVSGLLHDYMSNDGIEPAVLLQALEIAVKNNVRKMNYIDGIVKGWLNKGIKTKAALDYDIAEYKRQKEAIRNKDTPKEVHSEVRNEPKFIKDRDRVIYDVLLAEG